MIVFRIAIIAAAALCTAGAGATPRPERGTEWPPTWTEGPFFYCANGMGVQLSAGEGFQRPTYEPGNAIVMAMGGLGPLTRIRLAHVVAEVQWPALASGNDGPSPLVYWNTRLELLPISRSTWALALAPGNPNEPEERSVEAARKSVAIRFPMGEHSDEGLELARRLEYVPPDDRRCANRS
jgi:hypothetical protein